MDTTPTRDRLASAIRGTVDRYVATGLAPDARAINEGQCEDLACDVAESLGGETVRFEGTWADNLTVGGNGAEWDIALLRDLSPGSEPTHGLTWEEANDAIPAHYWLMLDGRHHDAECPDGVDNLFEMPVIRRSMERIAVEKSVAESDHGSRPDTGLAMMRERASRADVEATLALLGNTPDVPADEGDEFTGAPRPGMGF